MALHMVLIPRGSSPHTRGTLPFDITDKAGERIIPAYAGNTYRSRMYAMVRAGSSPHTRGTPSSPRTEKIPDRDHPRIRGEHARPLIPRGFRGGIIPAYAGNTAWMARAGWMVGGSSPHTRGTPRERPGDVARRGDHPRIRGEHFRSGDAALGRAGIIPAYAGNTRER